MITYYAQRILKKGIYPISSLRAKRSNPSFFCGAQENGLPRGLRPLAMTGARLCGRIEEYISPTFVFASEENQSPKTRQFFVFSRPL